MEFSQLLGQRTPSLEKPGNSIFARFFTSALKARTFFAFARLRALSHKQLFSIELYLGLLSPFSSSCIWSPIWWGTAPVKYFSFKTDPVFSDTFGLIRRSANRMTAVFAVFQATVVHDMDAKDLKSVSAANRMTIADQAIAHFHKNVSEPLKALTALRHAGKQ